jgi:superfamily II DNA/RNA helicase
LAHAVGLAGGSRQFCILSRVRRFYNHLKLVLACLVSCYRVVDAVVATLNLLLLLQGVDVVAVHGDKDQLERLEAIRDFKSGA